MPPVISEYDSSWTTLFIIVIQNFISAHPFWSFADYILFDFAEVLEVLVKSGRQLEAVNLAYAFELTDKFDPVSLLKAYLKDARKGSQFKAGNASPIVQVWIFLTKILCFQAALSRNN